MKSFFLSSFKRQAKVLLPVSLLLVAGWYALLIITALPRWNAAQNEFDIWNSKYRERCERLFENARNEIEAVERTRCDVTEGEKSSGVDSFENMVRLAKQASQMEECITSQKARQTKLLERIRESNCPTYQISGGKYDFLPILDTKYPPKSLPIYALESNRVRFLIFPVAFIGIALFLMLFADFIKRVLTDKHSGWKRLNLVVSSMSGAIVAGWLIYDGEDAGVALIASAVALCVVGACFVYGRSLFFWVAEGFSPSSSKDELLSPLKSGQLISKSTLQNSIVAPLESKARDDGQENERHAAPIIAARFWPRLWARCIDLTLCWVIGSVAAAFLPDFRSMVPGMGGILIDLLVGMFFICSAVFFYESFFISRFGATPGKMLFGLSVVSVDGGLASSVYARKRALSYLTKGLELCFYVPYFQILGAIFAWRRRHEAQPWEMVSRTFTKQRPIGHMRFVLGALLALTLFSVMIVTSKVAKEITKEEFRSSVEKEYGGK